MQNLKIRVNSEAESREAQELFFELGLRFVDVGDFEYPQWLAVIRPDGKFSNYSISKNIWHTCNPKEITLPELRSMVKPMKEYLDANRNYELVLSTEKDDGFIEIPEGAIRARFYQYDPDALEFENSACQWWGDETKNWIDYMDYSKSLRDSRVVWQRATHPEELPFIDDEPKYTNDEVKYMDENGQGRLQSINDQYAEIEQVRQVEIHGTVKAKPDLNFGAAQAIGGAKIRENNHYFIDVSDVDEVDFYEIAKRYNVTDPAVQHILKKCLAIGNRGHKDLETDLKDILKTAKRALQINGFGE